MKKRVIAVMLTAVLAVGSLASCSKKTEKYPANDIQMIVPVKAGGDTDANARLLAKYMEPELGVSILIVNVAGSSGTVGMEQAKSAVELISKEG